MAILPLLSGAGFIRLSSWICLRHTRDPHCVNHSRFRPSARAVVRRENPRFSLAISEKTHDHPTDIHPSLARSLVACFTCGAVSECLECLRRWQRCREPRTRHAGTSTSAGALPSLTRPISRPISRTFARAISHTLACARPCTGARARARAGTTASGHVTD